MDRICSKCNLQKRPSDFYQRKKYRTGEYYEKCKECMKVRGRSYYHQNQKRQIYLAKIRKRKYIDERLEFLAVIKKKPCMDCGKIFPPWVMDFDHKEGQIKIASISNLVSHGSATYERIKAEIEKCDLVCSNCHRQRTHDRIQKLKLAAVTNVVKVSA